MVGSAAAPGHYGILSNLNSAVYYAPSNDYTGFVSDGFGSGGSPQPYAKDPLSAFTARGQQEDRPVVVDGYFVECVRTLPFADT